MGKKEIEEKVKDITVEHLGRLENDLKLESNFVNDLGADSLDEVELMMYFEEEFDIEIPDKEAEKIKTVSDAVDYIFNAVQGAQ